ncbi:MULTISPECIES: PQQ-dependent sugar dehydrogenase [unclassified Paenibacillus]|uniref:PQQ-dependent sugar dehydrogenase n=1 Tax=unclassified Paenibacillus TaxID=185978 RepID=UPI0009A5B6F2|nr:MULTISPECIES: PQQ-dependent sugar dehydrogenase [unclassified Paenibacillus]SLK04261.1 Glucose/arabinose dehydrogenase, beta-propeller fold [Paenibacillus sp. RU5A]SOC69618.1 Glucose/arabinose dehydrogenase, beta-propeller fold [Paenibacillus sp. RU26A]SOC72040.1 Glucose/arabinose dehydrogenase, beta-propeller fold [Paenibacillus sp. RU5M]
MNNRLSVPLYASLLSMALLTACTSGDPTTESQQTSQGQGTGQGQTAEGGINSTGGGEEETDENAVIPYEASVLVDGLNVPWELVSVPDGRMFVTERPGTIRVIENGELASEPLIEFSAPFNEEGEGGLLGLAADPDFDNNGYLYAYHSYLEGGGDIANRVLRLKVSDGKATIDKELLSDIPGGVNHNGGRIKIGPDNLLYITTGERYEPELAQNEDSLGGKILRIGLDGSIPEYNPWPNSPVYSMGHRNAQGLAWNLDNNYLYATEHGQRNFDEINRIEAGENYGWPEVEGDDDNNGTYQAPLAHSGDETWAPSGVAFIEEGPWAGSLLAANLRGEQLLKITLSEDGTQVTQVEPIFKNEWGRIRNVTAGEDGKLYVLTNNRDGRGSPRDGDDQLIVLTPKP